MPPFHDEAHLDRLIEKAIPGTTWSGSIRNPSPEQIEQGFANGMEGVMEKQYLGDGLYAEFDGWQFRLWTERENGVHEVYLEPSVAHAFFEYTKHVYPKARGE